MKKKKLSKIAVKILAVAVIPLALVVLIASLGSAYILGSNLKDEVEKQLKLAVYAIEKETAQMSASNTKMETVDSLIKDFKEKNTIDITIFDGDTRVFSTVPDAVGTKMDAGILASITNGEHYFSKNANVNGEKYYAYYVPVIKDNEYVGAFFAGEPASRVDKMMLSSMGKILMFGLMCGLIFIIFDLFIVSKIVRKLEHLKAVVDTLTENDLAVKYDKCLVEKDEIDTINNGTIDFSKQLGVIVSGITFSSNELKGVASDLRRATELTTETAEEISNAVTDVAKGAVSQAEETTNASVKISTISEELGGIKGNVQDLHDVAGSIENTKNIVVGALEELQKVNNIMANDIEITSKQVTVTSEDVNRVRDVVKMIEDIAGQTKLLSLNASIESARAGEQGRGFAVVAEEIGKLAEQVSKFSAEIENILKDLSSNYAMIIENVQATTDNMAEQSIKLSDTEKAFTGLEADIDKTVERVTEINSKVANIDNEIRGMVEGVTNLSAISEENSASTEQISSSIDEFKETIARILEKAQKVDSNAEALREKISVFKTE